MKEIKDIRRSDGEIRKKYDIMKIREIQERLGQ